MRLSNFARLERRKRQCRLPFRPLETSSHPMGQTTEDYQAKNSAFENQIETQPEVIDEKPKSPKIRPPSTDTPNKPQIEASRLGGRQENPNKESDPFHIRSREKSILHPRFRCAVKDLRWKSSCTEPDSSGGSEAESDGAGYLHKRKPKAQITSVIDISEKIEPDIDHRLSANQKLHAHYSPEARNSTSLVSTNNAPLIQPFINEDKIKKFSPNIMKNSSSTRSMNMKKDQSDDNDFHHDNIVPTRKIPAQYSQDKSLSEESEEDVQSSPLKRRRLPVTDKTNKNLYLNSKTQQNLPEKTRCSDDSDSLISPTKRLRSGEKEFNKNLHGYNSPSESARTSSSKRYTRQMKTRSHRTEKEKALELMRRKRAGERLEKLSSSESSDELEYEFQTLSDFEDDEITKHERLNYQDNEDSEDTADSFEFILEDDEGLLGVPDYSALIPIQFTHAAHKPLKEHFRDVIEWMVKNKIFPDFAREDEIYLQAFRRLDDICQGLAKSKFISTQWTQEFLAAIWSRPYFTSGPLTRRKVKTREKILTKCDACNHRKHAPSSFIRLHGMLYDKKTLNKPNCNRAALSFGPGVENLDSSGEGSPIHSNSIESKRWLVGNICKKNAEYSHRLIHWKFALNEWVNHALNQEELLTSQKVGNWERMETRQIDQLANEIVDTWEKRGIIKSLYQDWKNQRTAATEIMLTQDRWK
ncbi:Bgt-4962 [Blumeria graminis f. sp. tritici]|uniref:Bgt-4962 n=1 Tax=Blumeria graminis f. sp. tritici TaxID=62690 RepID=A0A9X9MPZ7_BLUGR|nr:Bgt-4962 [Blumeria graminis f. sp. tritici]